MDGNLAIWRLRNKTEFILQNQSVKKMKAVAKAMKVKVAGSIHLPLEQDCVILR